DSIHDDAQAQKLGFRGGFVPGSVVGTAAMPAVSEAFGEAWMNGGWYSFTFVSPVYVNDEVREIAQGSQEEVAIQVVDRDGRLCCNGRAGLGATIPWDLAADGTHGAEGVLPGIEIGHRFHDELFVPDREACLGTVASGGDETPWYRERSPWGGPIVPPEYLQVVALHLVRHPEQARVPRVTGVREPGMWAQHDLAISGPLFFDKEYRISERVADKGRSGRTVYLTYEFEVFDGDRRLVHARHKAKWLAEVEVGSEPA
ncbi:MAG: MaoC family dehydratase, partial [bacterium]